MKLPCYPRYLTSRDPWVGSVPAHWKVLRADFTTASNKEQISDRVMEGIQVLHYSIPNVQEFGTAQVEDGNDIDSSKLQIKTAQLLISKLNPRKATLCIAEPDKKLLTVCSGEFIPIIPEGELTLRYCYYTWLSDKVTKMLSSRVQSVTRSHQRVSPEDITRLPWAWPPADEQKHIAAFLDWKTGQIDALIAKNKELLEKLKEKCIAVITQAVTKGLNSAAPMRDSGIPWLGQVPQHWEVKRLKFQAGEGKGEGIQIGPFGGMLTELTYAETGEFKLYGQENVLSGDFEKGTRWITADQYTELSQYGAEEGDFLFTRKGSIGGCAIFPETAHPGIIDSDTIRLRVNRRTLSTRFLLYAFRESEYLQFQVQLIKRGAILSGLNTTTIANLMLAAPPLDEQIEIAEYLDRETTRVNQLALKVECAIDRLAEYRTALITAATTGKIDVSKVKVPTQGQL